VLQVSWFEPVHARTEEAQARGSTVAVNMGLDVARCDLQTRCVRSTCEGADAIVNVYSFDDAFCSLTKDVGPGIA
jgi:hypothetical protein